MKRFKVVMIPIVVLLLLISAGSYSNHPVQEGRTIVKVQESVEGSNEVVQEQGKGVKDLRGVMTVSEVRIPDWSTNSTIYEVNIRQYTKEGTFKAFEEHLPRLNEMGVDILWFMPIYPISEKNRIGTLGSYYAIQDYKNVNPEFGTSEDFEALVEKAHSMGFKVLLDWVANHTGWDHSWTNQSDWYTTDSDGNIIHPGGTDWQDVADLNYKNEEMKAAMIDAMKYWVTKFDIDGYRADFASGVPTSFWETARSELESIKPIYMLAEDDKIYELLSKSFNSNYGWELYHIMNKIAKGEQDVGDLKLYFTRMERLYPEGSYPMHFTTNHDENSWTGTEYERLEGAVKTMATLTFTVPGVPLIYSGQESGLNKRLQFFDKDEIPWDDLSMQTFYQELITLKKENPALWNGTAGGAINFLETSDSHLMAYERSKEDNTVVVVMNLSSKNVEGEIKAEPYVGTYKSYPSQEVFNIQAMQSFNLGPWEYRIYIN